MFPEIKRSLAQNMIYKTENTYLPFCFRAQIGIRSPDAIFVSNQ